jgi:hypothetical protein
VPTYYLDPDGDDKADWTEVPVGTAFSALDDGVRQLATPDTSDYVQSSTHAQVTRFNLETFTLSAGETVTSVTAWAHVALASSNHSVSLIPRIAGGAAASGVQLASDGWGSNTWTRSFTQSEVNALQIQLTLNETAAEAGSTKVHAVYLEVETTISEVSVVNDRPDDSLALYVENPDGSERRLAGDEPSLPLTDYTLASTLPGGFSTLDGDAVIPANREAPFGKFAAVSARLKDRTVVWEGRTESTPERSDERLLRLACMGHQAALKDAAGIVFLGVHSDMSAWEDPARDYVEDSASSNVSVNAAVQVSTAENGITFRLDADRNVPTGHRGEIWFRSPAGEKVAEVQYVGSEANAVASMDSTVRVKDTATGATIDSGNLTLDLGVHSFVPSTAGVYAILRDSPNTTVNSAARVMAIHAVSVYGEHGLPRAEIDGLPDGLYFSDIIEYLIGLHTPLVTSVGGDSTIERSTFVLPHAAWTEATDLATILEDGIAYESGKDWAVWEGRAFHYGTRTEMGREWIVRRSEGARFIDTGETAAPDYNGVIVTYTDSDGVSRRVGPPGSGADTEDASLVDLDPDNPVNASSIMSERDLVVDVGDTKAEKAIELGEVALAEALRRRFTGEVELPRYAECGGDILPTSLIRAGDKIVDGDSPSREVLPLVGATYTRSSERPFQGTVDTPANRLDSAIARMEAKPRKINRKKIRRRYRRQRRRRQRQGNK